MIQSGKAKFPERLGPLMVPIDSIKQHDANPNNNDVEDIADSIRVNGFHAVIVVDEKTGRILAGNHRFQALYALGSEIAPVIYAEGMDGEKGKTRFMIGDNRTGQKAVMDRDMTIAYLMDLQQTEVGLAGTGYEDYDVERMLMSVANDIDDDGGHGWAKDDSPAPMGLYQVVIQFDNQEDRDECYTSLMDHYEGFDGKMRKADI